MRNSQLSKKLGACQLKPDYLLISHGHFDHLDLKTIEKFDECIALVPLKMGRIIEKTNKNVKAQEAGWYQQYNIDENFEITFLPSHHWHKRSINDYNKILWGSFLIKTKNKTIYFAGDTGYSNHFKDIQLIFKEIDIAIMPIGAYSPRWFMKSSHINPNEALMAAKDLNANKIIPMHFGTFDLSDEPSGEPEQIFKEIGKNDNLHFLDIGEKLII
jgi:L-ascorbate metabolism protein UlaG (beta-lactamase superfamily)